jgi:hypothetical protein
MPYIALMAETAVHIATYSWGGYTAATAATLAGLLAPAVTTETIRPLHPPHGLFGYMRAGFDALRHKAWPIAPIKPGSRNHVLVVGSPVWAGHLAPPVRTYLEEAGPSYFWLAALITHGRGGPAAALREIEAAAGQRVAVSITLSDADRADAAVIAKLTEFASALRRLAATEGQLDTRHFTPAAGRIAASR